VTDPFPAIAEASAGGETAATFEDIRATMGVRRRRRSETSDDHLAGDPRRQGKRFRAQWRRAFALIGWQEGTWTVSSSCTI
jgi:hypothetical protein